MKEQSTYADQLITNGIRQMGKGIERTISSEIRVGIPSSIIGLAIGAGDSAWHNRDVIPSMVRGGGSGAVVGIIAGWEYAMQEYNANAGSEGLPQAEWYDWLIAHVLIVGMLVTNKRNVSKHGLIAETAIVAQGINPITVSGARHVIGGTITKIIG